MSLAPREKWNCKEAQTEPGDPERSLVMSGIDEASGEYLLMTTKGSKGDGAAMPQAQDLQQSLKRLFLWLAISFVAAVAIRMLVFPLTGEDGSILFLLNLLLTALVGTAAYFSVAHLGIKWQVVIVLLALARAVVAAIAGGTFSLWRVLSV